MKLLVWDRTGFWLFYKRLEEGTFRIGEAGPRLELSARDLLLVLEGLELREVRQRRRYRRAASA